jgi:hypothetical protein
MTIPWFNLPIERNGETLRDAKSVLADRRIVGQRMRRAQEDSGHTTRELSFVLPLSRPEPDGGSRTWVSLSSQRRLDTFGALRSDAVNGFEAAAGDKLAQIIQRVDLELLMKRRRRLWANAR